MVRRGSVSEDETTRGRHSAGIVIHLYSHRDADRLQYDNDYSFLLSENRSLRVHTRIPGEKYATVHGLQARRAPRCQSRVPVVGLPVRAHVDPAWHIQKGRDVRLQENQRRKTGLETLRALVGL